VIRSNDNGLLLTCETCANWLGAPLADPSMKTTIHGLDSVLGGEDALRRVRCNDWKLETRCQRFTRFWEKEWDC
jgi:hypothetical protein